MSSITSQDFFKVLKNAMVSLNENYMVGNFDEEFESEGVIRLVDEKCVDLYVETEINFVQLSVYCFETEMHESVVLNINLDNLDEDDVKEKLECAYIELAA